MIAYAPILVRRDESIPAHIRDWTPRSGFGLTIARALPFLPEDLRLELLDRIASVAVMESELRIRVLRGLGLAAKGLIDPRDVVEEDWGLVSRRVVTNNGVGFLVDAFQNLVEMENMKFHALGTSSTAEAVGDSALGTELTTEYTGNVRATGTTSEFAANIFQTVATNTLDSGAPVIREHGVLSASAAGVLLDRSVFAAITLDGANGDGLTSDYRFTITAGS